MSGNGQNLPDAVENADDVQEEEDDDFGEFEGFEGGVERQQAQPAPSPWATFPDLLPVQSSPAEDGQGASTSRGNNAPPRDLLQPSPPNWPGPGASHEEPRPMPQQMRISNPPDVSLGTSQAVGGRVTPDNVHDASVAVINDHRDSQLDRLTQQLETAEQARSGLAEQVERLRLRNVELELNADRHLAQIQDLQSRLQHNQEASNNRLLEANHLNSEVLHQDMRHLQREIREIKESQVSEREASNRIVNELRTEVCDRWQSLESGVTRFLGEQSRQLREAVETVSQQTVQNIAGQLATLLAESMRNTSSGDPESNNSLLQSVKEELRRFEEQQKRAREQERQRLQSALRSALRHLGDTTQDGDTGSS